MVKAGFGVRCADILRLRAVDLIAKDPATARAMGIHATAAIVAFPTGRDAGDENAVSGAEGRDAVANGVDNADSFMSQDATWRATRHVALENMQISATDGRLDDLHHRIARRPDLRLWPVFKTLKAGSMIDKRFHVILLCCS
jgi:hypothetical protein